MSLWEKLIEKEYISIIEIVTFLSLMIIHIIYSNSIRQSDFGNLFDTFESSPLFDFEINKIKCSWDSHIIFHKWEGRKKGKFYFKNGIRYKTITVDETNIEKINEYRFCYKHISYKNLLYNGQIIKNEDDCPEKYNKTCGIIDTLNQKLCIKFGERCPLYDVGIGQLNAIDNNDNYNYNIDSNIYYNNDNYDNPNKKIIGKLILNEGQPCYRLNEKLWKKFDSDEGGENHLKCELEIFGKFNDDRYENKGDITYKQLYIDNLSKYNYKLIKNDLKDEKVNLYKREFLGINKSCDANSNINKDKYEKIKKYEIFEKDILKNSFRYLIYFWGLFLIVSIILFSLRDHIDFSLNYILFFLLPSSLLVLLIVIYNQIIILVILINNEISYNCSDDITNEVFRKENENIKKNIRYTKINLALDLCVFLFHVFAILIIYILDKYGYRLKNFFKKKRIEKVCEPNIAYSIKNKDIIAKNNDAIKIEVDNNNNINNKKGNIENNETETQSDKSNKLIDIDINDKKDIFESRGDHNDIIKESLDNKENNIIDSLDNIDEINESKDSNDDNINKPFDNNKNKNLKISLIKNNNNTIKRSKTKSIDNKEIIKKLLNNKEDVNKSKDNNNDKIINYYLDNNDNTPDLNDLPSISQKFSSDNKI